MNLLSQFNRAGSGRIKPYKSWFCHREAKLCGDKTVTIKYSFVAARPIAAVTKSSIIILQFCSREADRCVDKTVVKCCRSQHLWLMSQNSYAPSHLFICSDPCKIIRPVIFSIFSEAGGWVFQPPTVCVRSAF